MEFNSASFKSSSISNQPLTSNIFSRVNLATVSASSPHHKESMDSKRVSVEQISRVGRVEARSSLQKLSEKSAEPSFLCKRVFESVAKSETVSSSSTPKKAIRLGVVARSRDCERYTRVQLIGLKRDFDHESDTEDGSFNGVHSFINENLDSSLSHNEVSVYTSPINGHRKKLYAPRNLYSPTMLRSSGYPIVETEVIHDTDFDSLPLEILTRVVCCLKHKDLYSTRLVCKRLKEAVDIATVMHFNFTTPEHNRHNFRMKKYKRQNSLLCDHNCRGKSDACEASCEYRGVYESPCSSDREIYYPKPPDAPKPIRKHRDSKLSSVHIQRLVAPLFLSSPIAAAEDTEKFISTPRPQRLSPSASRSLFRQDSDYSGSPN